MSSHHRMHCAYGGQTTRCYSKTARHCLSPRGRLKQFFLHALRASPAQALTVGLVNLPMCRRTGANPDSAWQHVPLAVGRPPNPAQTHKKLLDAAVSCLLFNGQTDYVLESTHEGAASKQGCCAAVRMAVFGRQADGLTADDCAIAVKRLV